MRESGTSARLSEAVERSQDWGLIRRIIDSDPKQQVELRRKLIKLAIWATDPWVLARLSPSDSEPQIFKITGTDGHIHLNYAGVRKRTARAWRWRGGGISAIAKTEAEARMMIADVRSYDAR